MKIRDEPTTRRKRKCPSFREVGRRGTSLASRDFHRSQSRAGERRGAHTVKKVQKGSEVILGTERGALWPEAEGAKDSGASRLRGRENLRKGRGGIRDYGTSIYHTGAPRWARAWRGQKKWRKPSREAGRSGCGKRSCLKKNAEKVVRFFTKGGGDPEQGGRNAALKNLIGTAKEKRRESGREVQLQLSPFFGEKR